MARGGAYSGMDLSHFSFIVSGIFKQIIIAVIKGAPIISKSLIICVQFLVALQDKPVTFSNSDHFGNGDLLETLIGRTCVFSVIHLAQQIHFTLFWF